MKAIVAAFNQKALVGTFSVITNLWMERFEALVSTTDSVSPVLAGHTAQAWHTCLLVSTKKCSTTSSSSCA